MPLGLYISVPFCRTKCTYCNFASGVFSQATFGNYVRRVCADLGGAGRMAEGMGGEFDRFVDSVYLGGGTPTLLPGADFARIFRAIESTFEVLPEAEVTVECAPGTVTTELLEVFRRCGVNRVSLGMQSFVDAESRAVGRLHTRETALRNIDRLRAAGITNINLDLIAGLPFQTAESWTYSLEETVATGVPHVSVYMLEIDEDSRLGRELIAGGTRYHAHSVPDEDLTVEFYAEAVRRLKEAGICQYEISNFARTAYPSRHNLKYWTRQPYLGFGVDSHSMLTARTGVNFEAVRFSTPDSLDAFLGGEALTRTIVSETSAVEEEFFLGLRLNRGVDLPSIGARYRIPATINAAIADLVGWGLLERNGDMVRLTDRGRLLSNEVFERFLVTPVAS